MSDLAGFLAEVERSKELAVKRFVEFQKSVAIAAFQMIAADSRTVGMAYGSPVWSGYYRQNHNISIGEPNTSVRPPNPETVGPGATRWPDEPDRVLNAQPVSYAAQALQQLKPFDVVYITNASPHAKRIEEGWSKFKAPEGVYAVTAEAVRARFSKGSFNILNNGGE